MGAMVSPSTTSEASFLEVWPNTSKNTPLQKLRGRQQELPESAHGNHVSIPHRNAPVDTNQVWVPPALIWMVIDKVSDCLPAPKRTPRLALLVSRAQCSRSATMCAKGGELSGERWIV